VVCDRLVHQLTSDQTLFLCMHERRAKLTKVQKVHQTCGNTVAMAAPLGGRSTRPIAAQKSLLRKSSCTRHSHYGLHSGGNGAPGTGVHCSTQEWTRARGWESPRFQQQIIRTKSKHKKLKGGITPANGSIGQAHHACMGGSTYPTSPTKSAHFTDIISLWSPRSRSKANKIVTSPQNCARCSAKTRFC
jgi:hypothetical protein